MRRDYAYYEVDVVDRVAVVRFRREVLAADPPSHAEETTWLVREIGSDPDVEVAVFVGTGERFAPTKSPNAGTSGDGATGSALRAYEIGRSFVHALADLEKVVIAALNGDAVLVGLTVALLSDIVVAERQIVLRDAHVPLGVPASTGPFIWPASIGLLRAKRYLLTGEEVTAIEAERIGLVSEVVEEGAAEERAQEYASQLVAFRPEALRGTKRALNETLRGTMASRFDATFGAEHLAKAGAR